MLLIRIPITLLQSLAMPMTTKSTPLSLLAFLYRELTPEDTRAVQQELAINAMLTEELDGLMMAKRALPRVTFSPSDQSMSNILAYSLACPVEA